MAGTKKGSEGEENYSIQSLFHKRIEFHPARKQHSSNAVGNFPLETLNSKTNGTIPSSDNENGEVVDHGLVPELSYGTTFRRIGAGLQNLGNTCFLNSVLQCLTYTEPFAAYLQSGKHKSYCQIVGFCALCAIQNHVRCALQSTGKIVAPRHLVTNMRCILRNFRNGRQEDAHEYLVNLLEAMHKCCLPSGLSSELPAAYEKSLVYKIFGGRLRSQVKCTECLHGLNKYDPFLGLSIEIAKADSLLKALRNFTCVEVLDGGEKQYHCQRCNQKVGATRQLMIFTAPHVLTIHLKRFVSFIPGEKINKRVEFGPTLDFKPFVTGTHEGDLMYTLYGVLVHDGWSTHSGHYYCFVRTSSGMWYVLNDHEIFQVKEKTVLEQKAYMLFYVRDRRSISPKKPVAICKENVEANEVKNKERSVPILRSKDSIQNEILAKASKAPVSGPIVAKADEVARSVKESTIKSRRGFKSNGVCMGGSDIFVDSVDSFLRASSVLSDPNSSNNQSCMVNHLKAAPLVVEDGSAVNESQSTEHQSAQKNAPKREESESVVALMQSGIPNRCGRKEPPSHPDGQKVLKSRKHMKKSQVAGIHSRLSLVLRALLRVRKKKKHKRSRNHNFDDGKSAKKDFGKDCLSDLEPSTSEKTRMKDLVLSLAQKREGKSGANNGHNRAAANELKDSYSECVSRRVGIEYGERVDHSNVLIASTELPMEASTANNRNHKKFDTIQSESSVHGFMNLLTTGSEDTAVARWDQRDTHQSEFLGSTPSTSIGYVPDEWDEEYDRGKRKKVRRKENGFSGSNPFQEMAEKASRMKANLNSKQRK